jgi:hypothetical protein
VSTGSQPLPVMANAACREPSSRPLPLKFKILDERLQALADRAKHLPEGSILLVIFGESFGELMSPESRKKHTRTAENFAGSLWLFLVFVESSWLSQPLQFRAKFVQVKNEWMRVNFLAAGNPSRFRAHDCLP